MKCNLKTLKLRDTKGLYKKADLNIINNLIGYKSKLKYEKSNYKKITINTDKLNISNSTKKILKKLVKKTTMTLFFKNFDVLDNDTNIFINQIIKSCLFDKMARNPFRKDWTFSNRV